MIYLGILIVQNFWKKLDRDFTFLESLQVLKLIIKFSLIFIDVLLKVYWLLILLFGMEEQRRKISVYYLLLLNILNIIGVSLPSLHEIYLKRIKKKSNTILKDNEHPANKYFELLPSGKR